MAQPKIPNLIKPIDLKAYNDQLEKNGMYFRVKDINKNGKVDHEDQLVDKNSGKPPRLAPGLSTLIEDECFAMGPAESPVSITPDAQKIIDKYNKAHPDDTIFKTGKMSVNKSDGIVLPHAGSILAFGGYDQKLKACHYNQGGLIIDKKSDHELSIQYTDSNGRGESTFDLKTSELK